MNEAEIAAIEKRWEKGDSRSGDMWQLFVHIAAKDKEIKRLEERIRKDKEWAIGEDE